MQSADQAIYIRAASAPHMSPETCAYYAGRNAVWAAVAENEKKIDNPHSEFALRTAFARGVRNAMSEERLDLDTGWD